MWSFDAGPISYPLSAKSSVSEALRERCRGAFMFMDREEVVTHSEGGRLGSAAPARATHPQYLNHFEAMIDHGVPSPTRQQS